MTMNGLYLLGFGPRLADAVRDPVSSVTPTIERWVMSAAPTVFTTGWYSHFSLTNKTNLSDIAGAVRLAMRVGTGLGGHWRGIRFTHTGFCRFLQNEWGFLFSQTFQSHQEAVVVAIRLPRVLLNVLVGAGLAVSGAAMQGLFRNPLAGPRSDWRVKWCCIGCGIGDRPGRDCIKGPIGDFGHLYTAHRRIYRWGRCNTIGLINCLQQVVA